MSVRQLETRAIEKVWGRHDIPSIFGNASELAGPVGEIWFESQQDSALLIKYLFTSQKLSIQVHPSDEQARAMGHPRGKDEAWYVLSAKPGAEIGAGFDNELSSSELRAAALDGSIDALLTWHRVAPGDFFYVPAGTVHAIGAGVSLLEIQQNADVTYRLFDYSRPRELQLEEGLAASRAGPFVRTAARTAGASRDVLVAGPKIVIERLHGASEHHIGASTDGTVWLMPISGRCAVDDTEMPAGTVWLADAPSRIRLEAEAHLLTAYPGDKTR